jgi:flagellar biosynthesis protein FlhG
MKQKDSMGKIIRLPNRVTPENNKSGQSNARNRTSNAKVIAITSGKGGVGKTNIVANIGFALSQMGKRVLILDADLGLGNIDVLLGLTPKYNLSHVVMREKTASEIIIEGPKNLKILPASSGIQELTQLTEEQRNNIFSELDSALDHIDILLIDTAAGISSNVMYFNMTAQEVLVVVTPEPTSMTDAYALMKVMSLKYSAKKFRLLVNLATNSDEAHEIFRQLTMVTNRFLDISIEYLGYVLADENVTKSVKRQKLLCDIYPNSAGSKCFTKLAEQICKLPPPSIPKGDSNFLWEKFL